MSTYKIRGRKARDPGSRIAATEAAKTFGRLVDRVREERATYVIERGGKPVAQIGPVETRGCTLSELAEFLRSQPKMDEAVLRSIENGIARFNRPAVPKDPWAR